MNLFFGALARSAAVAIGVCILTSVAQAGVKSLGSYISQRPAAESFTGLSCSNINELVKLVKNVNESKTPLVMLTKSHTSCVTVPFFVQPQKMHFLEEVPVAIRGEKYKETAMQLRGKKYNVVIFTDVFTPNIVRFGLSSARENK